MSITDSIRRIHKETLEELRPNYEIYRNRKGQVFTISKGNEIENIRTGISENSQEEIGLKRSTNWIGY